MAGIDNAQIDNDRSFDIIDDESVIDMNIFNIESKTKKQSEEKEVLFTLVKLQQESPNYDIDLIKLKDESWYNFIVNEEFNLEIKLTVSTDDKLDTDTTQIMALGKILAEALTHIDEIELDYEWEYWLSIEKDSDKLWGLLGYLWLKENFVVTENFQEIFNKSSSSANEILKKFFHFIMKVKSGSNNQNIKN